MASLAAQQQYQRYIDTTLDARCEVAAASLCVCIAGQYKACVHIQQLVSADAVQAAALQTFMAQVSAV